MIKWLRRYGGQLGVFFRQVGAPLRARAPGVAVAGVFPLPWIPHHQGSDGDRMSGVPIAVLWTNIWVGLLNWLYGETMEQICWSRPSAPQGRVLPLLQSRAAEFCSYASRVDMTGNAIHEFLCLHLDDYREHGGVRPLGVRVGVPDFAAVVDVADALKDWDPQVSRQCYDPEWLLLPVELRPQKGRARCLVVDDTYPLLVRRSVRVGL